MKINNTNAKLQSTKLGYTLKVHYNAVPLIKAFLTSALTQKFRFLFREERGLDSRSSIVRIQSNVSITLHDLTIYFCCSPSSPSLLEQLSVCPAGEFIQFSNKPAIWWVGRSSLAVNESINQITFHSSWQSVRYTALIHFRWPCTENSRRDQDSR